MLKETEIFTCQTCGKEFKRILRRGAKPLNCPVHRKKARLRASMSYRRVERTLYNQLRHFVNELCNEMERGNPLPFLASVPIRELRDMTRKPVQVNGVIQ